MTRQSVSTCLWFGSEAKAAAEYYTALIPNSRITQVSHYGANQPMPEGTVLTVVFELDGTEFMALNGGAQFSFTEASSMVAKFATQAEIDRFWSRLLADGGQELQCFWIKDRYGLCWQVIPGRVMEWIAGEPVAAARVMEVIMSSVKPDLARLQRAFDGN